MNVGDDEDRAPIDPAIWDAPTMRTALAAHDIASVFQLLKRAGVPQGRIAALTGHTQPDVSRIMNRRHLVQSYAVLDRIATGLGIPRGLMGLAYAPGSDPHAAVNLVAHDGRETVKGEVGVQRRAFIALVAQAAIVGGLSEVDLDRLAAVTGPSAPGAAAFPGKVGDSDAVTLEDTVAFLRAQDGQAGGGAVRAAATGYLDWAASLATASGTDPVKRRIQVAHADLYSVAGWASFDIGDHATAKRHLGMGLAIAKDADQPDLAATILWQLGRVFLHAEDPDGALKMFQLGHAAAQDADSTHAVALMHINSAWAYSEMGKTHHVATLVARASEELERACGDAPSWLTFMGHTEIQGIAGVCYAALSARDRTYADTALEHASTSLRARAATDTRRRAFDLIGIATAQLRAGDPDAGCQSAHQALAVSSTVRSSRLTDRQAWIAHAARLYPRHSGARELVATLSAPTHL
ncbi:XRE family transcriptional regulator [Actinokineospora sp. NBRC 105648]|uniref:XRE family transcriptional regulator n=1 Tax=Actinokineospora sp. NBRC 105648 TaxID=3032206 RepID=UPI0024A2D992|nr:XRE family transcriptional regulator [Actinokineospora sp. NBRC 105648]GLZ42807.1 XRE family transcriptional regulator [Actinokineospora sp. NBRC 105648]